MASELPGSNVVERALEEGVRSRSAPTMPGNEMPSLVQTKAVAEMIIEGRTVHHSIHRPDC